jgi:hypothetical protein
VPESMKQTARYNRIVSSTARSASEAGTAMRRIIAQSARGTATGGSPAARRPGRSS